MKLVKLTAAAAVMAVGFVMSASAMPVQKLGTEATGAQIDQVRLVCNRWGRCWHVGGWRRGYYAYGWHPGWHRRWYHRHW
jgi:hypothetical protein